MYTNTAKAPSNGTLRPLRKPTPGFPVYPNLTDTLLDAMRTPGKPTYSQHAGKAELDLVVAHVLATCASYAYSDEDTLSMIMARLGLADNRVLRVSLDVDAMLIASTAFLVQSADGRVVILCYRGTPPTDLINWFADIQVDPERIRFRLDGATPTVHAGFYRNARSTRYRIVEALAHAVNAEPLDESFPKPDHPLEALFITGHSFGAAMAALMGVMLKTDPDRAPIADKMYPVHTFGQPMVGDGEFARKCEEIPWNGDGDSPLSEHFVRWVYQKDIVAVLPPTASGSFEHFGVEYQFEGEVWKRRDKPVRQLRNLAGLVTAPIGFLTRQVEALREVRVGPSIDDHFPHHYVARLTPAGVLSEFGD
ncbi:lipase family protein [Amycolatopsis sp. K13G38]|uniref:Lipase family protein n=1 Tax=Amycolatopsis acididurans TaxID=2724524 RepID=A0ABX1J5K7_9PSEU|nr:lipase family protein [Amycolatopsis acididurans]NKQ54641.1 lipase family protein [Amycolatopsis acididurans]